MSAQASTVALAYLTAWLVALLTGFGVPVEHPIWVALWADVAATLAIFGFSVAYRNSSFYDVYWSVAPLLIALYFVLRPEITGDAALRQWIGLEGGAGAGMHLRQALVLTLVAVWGCRLTWNWFRGWDGLAHEDWRYVDLQKRFGSVYWLVSFSGIHMAPTLWVFLGCLALYPALSAPSSGLGWLDGLALAITAGAIWLESRADIELVRYRAEAHPVDDFLRSGVWAWCRHPNYLGEMGFWWGLYLFGLAANPGWAWTIVGPLAITLMFRFVSLPMIEDRMLERRPAYREHIEQSSLVLPRWQR